MRLKVGCLSSFMLFLFYFSGFSQFSERGTEIGIDHIYLSSLFMGGGAAFFDYNNDGFLDLYVTGGESSDKLFLNLGDKRFLDVSTSSEVFEFTKNLTTTGVVTGDINNDGCKDLFITTFDSPALLLLNNCDGTFNNISQAAGITHPVLSTGAVFLDYNQDRFLDIYVTNYIEESVLLKDDDDETIGFDHKCRPNLFYVNNGDNTFSERGQDLGVADAGCGLAVAATDYDGDGDQDLYVANDFGEWVLPNAIYSNDYPLDSFTNRAQETNLNTEIYAMGIAVGDYDGDLDLDYYVTNIGRNVLLQNEEANEFIDVTTKAKVENNTTSGGGNTTGWGTVFFDHDNDGDLDLYVSNGYVISADFLKTSFEDPDVLYQNTGNGGFANKSEDLGLGSKSINRGVVFGDYDNDGDLDLFVVTLSAFHNPADTSHCLFYENMNTGNNWLEIELEGVTGNRDAYGSLVTIYSDDHSTIRELFGGGSHASQNSPILHFGLGDALVIDSIKVAWPGGSNQIYGAAPINQRVYLKQGDNELRVVGCTDPVSLNYNPLATYNTGCFAPVIQGCTDPSFANYDPEANLDDGSCQGTVTSVEQLEPNEIIKVFPMPFENYLSIEIRENGYTSQSEYLARIVDIYGREMPLETYMGQLDQGQIQLNTRYLEEGIYFLILTDGKSRSDFMVQRIIKY